MDGHIRINARAVIVNNDQVLVCQLAGKQHYFLPGGGVELKEGVEEALKRELQEELGVNVITSKFIGGVENLFDNDGEPYHELNLLFSVTINDYSAQSQEVGHISFAWIPLSDLATANVLPTQLVSAVMQWLKDKQNFWVGLNKA